MPMVTKVFDRTIELSVVIIFISFSIIMIGNIISRYVFNFSFTWSDEAIRYSFIWMVLLASGIAVKRRAHLGFDLIVSKLPKKIQVIFNLQKK